MLGERRQVQIHHHFYFYVFGLDGLNESLSSLAKWYRKDSPT